MAMRHASRLLRLQCGCSSCSVAMLSPAAAAAMSVGAICACLTALPFSSRNQPSGNVMLRLASPSWPP